MKNLVRKPLYKIKISIYYESVDIENEDFYVVEDSENCNYLTQHLDMYGDLVTLKYRFTISENVMKNYKIKNFTIHENDYESNAFFTELYFERKSDINKFIKDYHFDENDDIINIYESGYYIK